MPNPELTQYFDSLPADKLLRYKPMRQEKNIHQGVDYRYDHQGGSQPSRGLTDNSNTNTMQSFKSNGKEYHNVQVQLNKQAKSVNLKGLSRRNGTCPSAACVLVAYDWEGPEAVLRAALEQSNDLGSGDGKYCRKIWLYEDGTTEPAQDGQGKADQAAEERKAAKAAKEAGDARRRANRN